MNSKDPLNDLCPCGSNVSYGRCCKPLHQGAKAASAEALMRARFSGFALQLSDYLLTSWHTDKRPEHIELEPDTHWRRLKIISANNDDQFGNVHFRAYYQESQQWHLLEETSKFVFENGHWFYHSGNYTPHVLKPNRNNQCPCGSGKKFKKCCS
jgi:SEC-C motif-containing protein